MNSPSNPSHAHINNQYDVIIIGAGISGLITAGFLAQGGARVLVCEQNAQVGGLFNSFEREGYRFDGGIKAVENSAVLMPILAQLGLLEKMGFQPSPIALVTNGQVQPMRSFSDVEAYFRLLGDLFPTERTGLQRIERDARSVFEVLDGLLSFPIPYFDPPGADHSARKAWLKSNRSAISHMPGAFVLMSKELRPYLQRRLSDTGLLNLLSDLFPDGTSVFFGLGYFRMYLDYYYPQGGILTIPRVIADAIREWGSDIRLNTRVEQVLLRSGQACGVRLADGQEINADYVVAASDLRQALTGLVPKDVLPAKFERKLRRAEVSHSVFNVFLGIDIPVEKLNLQGCPHIFYYPDLSGINEADRISRPDYFTHVPQEISIPCLYQPNLAPKGKTGLNTSAMASWHFNGGWDRNPSDYTALKEKCARELINSLEKFIPHLSEHIELCVTATPRTVMNRTANQQGAIMGWSYRRQTTMPRGNFFQMPASVLTPIPHLLIAGHWAYSPGGSPVAVITAKLAAQVILRNRQQTVQAAGFIE